MNNQKKRWQFGIGGLFLVVTLIRVRLGLESQGWGWWSNRMGMITVEVDRPVSSELENKLRSNLRDVESVYAVGDFDRRSHRGVKIARLQAVEVVLLN